MKLDPALPAPWGVKLNQQHPLASSSWQCFFNEDSYRCLVRVPWGVKLDPALAAPWDVKLGPAPAVPSGKLKEERLWRSS
jgi:hypothetical protein